MKKLFSLFPVVFVFILITFIIGWKYYSTDPFFYTDNDGTEWEKGIKYNNPEANKAYDLHRKGLKIMKEGNLNHAEEHFQNLVNLHSNYVAGYLVLGVVQLQLKKNRKAKTTFLKAIEINPSNPQSYSRVGYVEALNGDCNKAIKYYKQALALKKNYGVAHYGIGKCYYEDGNFDMAKKHLNKTTSLIPNSQYGKYSILMLEKIDLTANK